MRPKPRAVSVGMARLWSVSEPSENRSKPNPTVGQGATVNNSSIERLQESEESPQSEKIHQLRLTVFGDRGKTPPRLLPFLGRILAQTSIEP